MKKSGDLSQAFLLKHFPEHRKMSSAVPAEVSWRNSVLVATTALILAVLTSVILYQQMRSRLQQEQVLRLDLEARLQRSESDAARYREAVRASARQAGEFTKEVEELGLSAGKEEKNFFNRITLLMEKYQLSGMSVTGLDQRAPEIAQGQPPWEKAR